MAENNNLPAWYSQRSKCTTEGCNNFGNESNNGKCNRCFHQWKPPGPNYKDKREFPVPLTLVQLAIHEGRPQQEIDEIKHVEILRQERLDDERKKKNNSGEGTQVRNRQGVSLDDDFTNYYDPTNILDEKINFLTELIKNAKTVVVYTGAGISTSAGISDYRSWDGAWTSRLLGIKPKKSRDMDDLRPTVAHMALYKLCSVGIVNYIVSTNLDNLHRRSGVTKSHLAELHGNCYLEICTKCNREYFRPTRVRSYSNHMTGNICREPTCQSPLKDSIINFGENLPEMEIKNASDWSKKADIALVLGSSLRVKPACWLTEYCYSFGNDGKIVICNLQKTDYESKSYLSLFAETDTIMTKLMKNLGLEIPTYDPSNDPTELLKFNDSNNSNDYSSVVPEDIRIGIAVNVSSTCPHVATNVNMDIISNVKNIDMSQACAICKHPNENWYCMQCGTISCGRHVQGHGLAHYNTTQHCIAVSFEDLSIWCYQCNDYIENKDINPVLFTLHKKKFGVPHPKQ